MSKNFKYWTLRCSQKIYTHLLAAYPKAHREKYGTAMRQLFDDQGRDAWNEARVWGLIKFWLHVLPDWFKTLTFEHFSALRQISPTRAFFILFLLVFFGVAATNFILPKYYVGETRILLRIVNAEKNKILVSSTVNDPYLIQTQMEILTSDTVLNPVVKNLALDEKWNKASQKPLSILEATQLLKTRVFVKSIASTSIIQIEVFDKNAKEAAMIANAIVDSYFENRAFANSFERQNLSASKPLNIQRLDFAQAWNIATYPNKTKILSLGALAGIVLGLIVAMVIKINHSISTGLSNQKMAAQN